MRKPWYRTAFFASAIALAAYSAYREWPWSALDATPFSLLDPVFLALLAVTVAFGVPVFRDQIRAGNRFE
jgi:hypothetical protein